MHWRLPATVCLLVVFASCRGSQSPSAPSDDRFDPPGLASPSDLIYCVEETNRYRAQRNRPPLAHDEDLSRRAHEAAASDQQTGTSHGYYRSHRFNGAENEALRWPFGGDVRRMMASAIGLFVSEGPGGGHYENVMGPYSRLGCGFAASGNSATFVQNFQ